MTFSKSFLFTVTLALCAVSTPLVELREPNPAISLPFARRVNLTGIRSLHQDDQRRATHLIRQGKARARADAGEADAEYDDYLAKRAASQAVTNTAVTYVASVKIGNPSTTYSLLIDTGSSNTWVGASSKKYTATSSSTNTTRVVKVSYGSGSFSGYEFTDTVSIAGLSVTGQSIGVATSVTGISNVDGILGVGPVALTGGTVTGLSSVPTLPDTLLAQGKISTEVLGISFNPTSNQTSNANGELTFGAVDTSKYTGSITYAPLTTTSPAKYYWGINQSITYGSATGSTVLASTAGIVDTGTTMILLASNAYSTYMSLTGAVHDNATGLLSLTQAQYANLKSLFFNIAGTSFELTANGQIWPRGLNQYIGGSSTGVYVIIGNLGSNSGAGLDFINGYAFLERFYSVYDVSNKRVGIASTANSKALLN